uniref:Sema domain, immunoglobulin domain (Ig), short basic domain, secreted, (semaphorin) 3B n=1 Tax=Nothobranchius furzeri TaxID=105023 RepID=A0A8C6PJU2_NOTFU
MQIDRPPTSVRLVGDGGTGVKCSPRNRKVAGSSPAQSVIVVVSLGKTLNLRCLLVVVGGTGGASARQPRLCQCAPGQLWLRRNTKSTFSMVHFTASDKICYTCFIIHGSRIIIKHVDTKGKNHTMNSHPELKPHQLCLFQLDCVNYVKIVHHYNRTHLYACGTGAFHPTCAFVEVGNKMEDHVFRIDPSKVEDGKGKSPYDPRHNAASVLIGNRSHTQTFEYLFSNTLLILRVMKYAVFTAAFLFFVFVFCYPEPKFVGSFWVPESENPDDDKIFFFFRETAVEAQGLGKSTYSRIGQLCRNDMGGQRSLVNKWTTFLKTRLICSVPGADGSDTYFDELRDVFLLQTRDRKNPLVYTVFSTSSSVFKGSAVCLYSMNDIRRAFLGPFAHKEGPNYQWVPFQGKVPYPRPGMCPSKTFGSFESTKGFPDDVIQFARHHPLMYNPVYSMGRRPVFVRTNVDYSFTQIVVDRVNAADGQYDVMFIGTDKGTVLKVISVPKESWNNMEELLLEELEVFKDASPVTNMQISSKRQQLYVGSDTGIAQVPLHRCSVYGKACAECCLARDPYCAWDGTSCTRYLPNTKRRFRRQDVRNGDPNTLCSGGKITAFRKLYGVEGSSTFLECIPKSLQAKVTWTYQKQPQNPREEVRLDDRILQTERGLLIRRVLKRDIGVYQCHAMEHGFTQTLLGITLEVVPSSSSPSISNLPSDAPVRLDPRSGGGSSLPNQKFWYRDFMQLVDHPNLSTVDQICEQVWACCSKKRKEKKITHDT